MDPSIRTHDVAFEQFMLIGGIVAVVLTVCVIIAIHLLNKDRRY